MKIAIDGPAGAGKSTVAREVAKKLGFLYVDTGAMYRALTLKALQSSVNLNSESELIALLNRMTITLRHEPGGQRVLVDGEDVTEQIRSNEVSKHVAQVASHPQVRRSMVEKQRQLAQRGKVVMDGRDIGTHVLPDADLKLFLTASIEERARRRYKELADKNPPPFEVLIEEIRMRDKQDEERPTSPLRKADDAIVIDTTNLSIDEVIDYILNLVAQKWDRGA